MESLNPELVESLAMDMPDRDAMLDLTRGPQAFSTDQTDRGAHERALWKRYESAVTRPA